MSKAYDPGFNRMVKWDVPILEGYDYDFLPNISSDPGSHHFFGLNNPSVVDHIRQWDPTHILIYGWKYPTYLRVLWSFRHSVCILFRGDSNLLDSHSEWKRWLRRFVLQKIYRFVDVALFVGSANKRYFEAHGLKSNQLRWVPHSVDHTRFTMLAVEPVRNSVTKFLFIGKLQRKKAPELLLSAAIRLLELGYSAFEVIFVGDGELRESLQLRSMHMKQVVWKGFINQQGIPAEYQASDVLILPSRGPEETWGLAVNEAFACGKPAIVSNKVGCAEDLVKQGKTGYVFDSENVTQLAEYMRQYLDKPYLAKIHGKAAWELIQNWSIEVQCDRIIEVLQNVQSRANWWSKLS